MDLISIGSALYPYMRYALLIFIFSLSGYAAYRRYFSDKYPIRLPMFIFLMLLVCWAAIVLGITTFSRPAHFFTGQVNLSLFSGYMDAWNKWSMADLQLIVLNIAMFMPLGFLLPLIHPRNQSFWRVLAISAIFTFVLELLQMVTGRGIFELDDLFHNIIGSLAGYMIIMAILTCYKERKMKGFQIVKAMAIPVLFTVLFGAASSVYHTQQYGNLPFKPAADQDMGGIDVQLKTELSSEEASACVYYNGDIRNINHGEQVAGSLARHLNLEQQGGMRTEGFNRQLSYTDDGGTLYHVTYDITDGSWTLFSESPGKGNMDIGQQKLSIEKWLKREALLPDNAIYQQQDERTIRWDLPEAKNVQSACSDFTQGFAMITLSGQQIPESILYAISDNKATGKTQIISEKQAYDALLDGEFSLFTPLQEGDRLMVNEIRLTYAYDTKGYYRPVYEFTGTVNDEADNSAIILIQADS